MCQTVYDVGWNYNGVMRRKIPAQKNLVFSEEEQQLDKQ